MNFLRFSIIIDIVRHKGEWVMKKYILYNPHAGDEHGAENAKKLYPLYIGHELIYRDLTTISDWDEFFASLDSEDEVIICGGDGTINRFVNDVKDIQIKSRIYYLPAGSGNDFARDLGRENASEPFSVKKWIACLEAGLTTSAMMICPA